MTPRRDQRGTALVAALGIALVMVPLSAFVMLQAHTDIAVERNLRHALETFYAAEAGSNMPWRRSRRACRSTPSCLGRPGRWHT